MAEELNFEQIVRETQEPLNSRVLGRISALVGKWAFNRTLNNLPDYLDGIKPSLKDYSPTSLVMYGRRNTARRGPIQLEFIPPILEEDGDNIRPSVERVYGFTALNELCTAILTYDVLKKAGAREWLLRRYVKLNMNDSFTLRLVGNFSQFKKEEVSDDEYLQVLIKSFITGNYDFFNEILRPDSGQDMYSLAKLAGQLSLHIPDGVEFTPQAVIEAATPSNFMFVAGHVNYEFPGIVNVGGVSNRIRTASAGSVVGFGGYELAMHPGILNDGISLALLLVGGSMLMDELVSNYATAIHENIHYLSQGLDHLGLTKVRTSRR